MSKKRRYRRICLAGYLTTPAPRDAPQAALNGDGCAKGQYDDGRPGEVFLHGAKVGSEVDGLHLRRAAGSV